jgi:uncharacterized damage-inducible protein DinB
MKTLEELKYPIGRFTPTANSTSENRAASIAILRQLPEALRAALEGLSVAQIDTPYREGGWTVRQTVHHLADSHANSYVRFKLALTEDWPTISIYDEAAWAELTDSVTLPVEVSLTFLDAMHTRWVALLESMSEAQFLERGFIHPRNGRQSLALALAIYDWHSRHHTAHIVRLRQSQGW